MKNNVYIAGSWKNRDSIKRLMDDIEDWGYKITADWTSHKGHDSSTDHVEEDLKEDLNGLQKCDCLIYCMDGIRSRGKYFELGYVTALKKPIGIYLLPTYYCIINPNRETLPFNIIIENESIWIKSRMYPILQTIGELKEWLSNI